MVRVVQKRTGSLRPIADVSWQLIGRRYVSVMLYSTLGQSVVAVGVGLLVGFTVASRVKRFVRRCLLAVALTIPLYPFIFELWTTSLDDPLGPVVWAFLAILHYFVPLWAFVASLGAGYYYGRERRLSHQLEYLD